MFPGMRELLAAGHHCVPTTDYPNLLHIILPRTASTLSQVKMIEASTAQGERRCFLLSNQRRLQKTCGIAPSPGSSADNTSLTHKRRSSGLDKHRVRLARCRVFAKAEMKEPSRNGGNRTASSAKIRHTASNHEIFVEHVHRAHDGLT